MTRPELAIELATTEREVALLSRAVGSARDMANAAKLRMSDARLAVLGDLLPYPVELKLSPGAAAQHYAETLFDYRDATDAWVAATREHQDGWERLRALHEELTPGFDRMSAHMAGWGL